MCAQGLHRPAPGGLQSKPGGNVRRSGAGDSPSRFAIPCPTGSKASPHRPGNWPPAPTSRARPPVPPTAMSDPAATRS